jgi:hypothetical protein
MNKLLILALIAAATCLAATSPAASETTELTNATLEQTGADIYPRWSVTGEWRVTHPNWTDILTLYADGSLITSRQQTSGKWILTADGGTPMLVLRWDQFGTESVSMVGPDHFRGQIDPAKFIDMRRGEVAMVGKGR